MVIGEQVSLQSSIGIGKSKQISLTPEVPHQKA